MPWDFYRKNSIGPANSGHRLWKFKILRSALHHNKPRQAINIDTWHRTTLTLIITSKRLTIRKMANVECSICYSNFTDTGERVPLVLPCGHSFCRCCLKSEMGTQNSVRCPTCRTTHRGGLDQIPRNFALVANISYYNQKIEKAASDVIHKIQRRIASRIKSARSRIRENAIAHEKLVLNLADSKAKIVALLTEKFYRKILQNVCCIVEVFSWFRNPELDEAIRKNWNLKRESIWWLTDDSSRLELWAVLCGWSLVTPSSIHVEKKKQAAIQKLTKTSW